MQLIRFGLKAEEQDGEKKTISKPICVRSTERHSDPVTECKRKVVCSAANVKVHTPKEKKWELFVE